MCVVYGNLQGGNGSLHARRLVTVTAYRFVAILLKVLLSTIFLHYKRRRLSSFHVIPEFSIHAILSPLSIVVCYIVNH